MPVIQCELKFITFTTIQVINEIRSAIESTNGVMLLKVDARLKESQAKFGFIGCQQVVLDAIGKTLLVVEKKIIVLNECSFCLLEKNSMLSYLHCLSFKNELYLVLKNNFVTQIIQIPFSVVYKINLLATEEQADKIASRICTLKKIEAKGSYLEEDKIAQVTVNIVDCETTSLHEVYEDVVREAKLLKLPVTGSVIVGMIPLKAILNAAEFYIQSESVLVLEEQQKIHLAINRLGLNQFDPNKQIAEYFFLPEYNSNLLTTKSVQEFAWLVSEPTPAPGGGSVAATVGALGAALATSVSRLSYGKKNSTNDPAIRNLLPAIQESIDNLLTLIDDDTIAFEDYKKVNKLRNLESLGWQIAMKAALEKLSLVPLNMLRIVDSMWSSIDQLVDLFHMPAISELQASVHFLRAAQLATAEVIRSNLRMECKVPIDNSFEKEMDNLINRSDKMSTSILDRIQKRLDERKTISTSLASDTGSAAAAVTTSVSSAQPPATTAETVSSTTVGIIKPLSEINSASNKNPTATLLKL